MAKLGDPKPAQGGAAAEGALQHMLLVRAGAWVCALPITDIVETMRALPIRAVSGAPTFVRGVSIIRGALLPVVHLASLLGAASGDERGARFVTVRTGSGQVALQVDEVMGAKHVDVEALAPTPPLLSEALPEPATRIGAVGGQMFAMLTAARLIPDDLLEKLMTQGAG